MNSHFECLNSRLFDMCCQSSNDRSKSTKQIFAQIYRTTLVHFPTNTAYATGYLSFSGFGSLTRNGSYTSSLDQFSIQTIKASEDEDRCGRTLRTPHNTRTHRQNAMRHENRISVLGASAVLMASTRTSSNDDYVCMRLLLSRCYVCLARARMHAALARLHVWSSKSECKRAFVRSCVRCAWWSITRKIPYTRHFIVVVYVIACACRIYIYICSMHAYCVYMCVCVCYVKSLRV